MARHDWESWVAAANTLRPRGLLAGPSLIPHCAYLTPPCPFLPCHMRQVDTHISRSRQILSTMSKRILQNKLIMWGIILLLLGAIGLVLWAKF